jgi:polar amino acid transport system substrate-binding protein
VTTLRRLKRTAATLLLVASLSGNIGAQSEDAPESAGFPGFRHVDRTLAIPPAASGSTAVLLADADFAPWSFVGADGTAQGIAVDITRKACQLAGVACDIRLRPFDALLPDLRAAAADGIVSGLRADAGLATEFALSRPYFQSLGRFVVRKGSPLATPDVRTLAGKRLGLVANSAHARFLETHYSRSALLPFDSSPAMLEALRTGQLDAAFGDAVQLSYWLSGGASRGCCDVLGKAFVDRTSFSRSLVLVLSRQRPELRTALDAALDQMETSQQTAKIFARYLPSPVW